jgi:hypothetical protein
MGLERVSPKRLRLVLSNAGGAAVNLAFTAGVSSHGLSAHIEPAALRLGRGEHATAEVRLDLRRPLLGPLRQHMLTVHSGGGGRDWSAETQLLIPPRLTKPVFAVLVNDTVVLLVAAGVALVMRPDSGAEAWSLKRMGRVDRPGEADEYVFRAGAGQVVYFDDKDKTVPPGDTLGWTLLDPAGEPVFEDEILIDDDVSSLTLKAAGDYRLRVFERTTPSATTRSSCGQRRDRRH